MQISLEGCRRRYGINTGSICCETVAPLIDRPRIMFCRLVTLTIVMGRACDNARAVLWPRGCLIGVGPGSTLGNQVRQRPETNGDHMPIVTKEHFARKRRSCGHDVRMDQQFMDPSDRLGWYSGWPCPLFCGHADNIAKRLSAYSNEHAGRVRCLVTMRPGLMVGALMHEPSAERRYGAVRSALPTRAMTEDGLGMWE